MVKSVRTEQVKRYQRVNRVKFESFKTDDEGNVLDKSEITSKRQKCKSCGKEFWYSFVRCPECQQKQE